MWLCVSWYVDVSELRQPVIKITNDLMFLSLSWFTAEGLFYRQINDYVYTRSLHGAV